MALVIASGQAAVAQGCAACRDATAGSAPHAQAGVRHGIVILGGAAVLVVGLAVCVGWQVEKRRPR
jgi:hypothetical protein